MHSWLLSNWTRDGETKKSGEIKGYAIYNYVIKQEGTAVGLLSSAPFPLIRARAKYKIMEHTGFSNVICTVM
jgi:hypothetical protein